MSTTTTINRFKETLNFNGSVIYIYSFTGYNRQINQMVLSSTVINPNTSALSNIFLITPTKVPVRFYDGSIIYFSGELLDDNFLIQDGQMIPLTFDDSIQITKQINIFSGLSFNYFVWLFKSPIMVEDKYLYIKLYYSDNALAYSAFLYLVPEQNEPDEFYNDKIFEFGALNDHGKITSLNSQISLLWQPGEIFDTSSLQFNDIFFTIQNGQQTPFSFVKFLPPGQNQYASPNFGKYFSFTLDKQMYRLKKFDLEIDNNKYIYVLFYQPCNSSNFIGENTPINYNGAIFYGPQNLQSFDDLQFISRLNSGVSRMYGLIPDSYDAVMNWVGGSTDKVTLTILDGYKTYRSVKQEEISLDELNCSILPNFGAKDNSQVSTIYNYSIETNNNISINGKIVNLLIRIFVFASDYYNSWGYIGYYTDTNVTMLTPIMPNTTSIQVTDYPSIGQQISIDNNQSLQVIWVYGQSVSKESTFSVNLIDNAISTPLEINPMTNAPDNIQGYNFQSALLPSRAAYQVPNYYWIFYSDPIIINNNSIIPVVLIFNSTFNIQLLIAYFFYVDENSFSDDPDKLLSTLLSFPHKKLGITTTTIDNIGTIYWNPTSKIENFITDGALQIEQKNFSVLGDLTRNSVADDIYLPDQGREKNIYQQPMTSNTIISFLIVGDELEQNYYIYFVKTNKNICIFWDSETQNYYSLCSGQKYKVAVKTTTTCMNDSLNIVWSGSFPKNIASINDVIQIKQNGTGRIIKSSDSEMQTFNNTNLLENFLASKGITLNSCTKKSSLKTFDDSVCNKAKRENIALYVLLGILSLITIFFILALLFKIFWKPTK